MNSSLAKDSRISKPNNREDADILNDVIVICRDGEELYRHAAKQVGDQRIRNMYMEMARVRLQMLGELKIEESNLPSKSRHGGSVVGSSRRWYAAAKTRADFHQQDFVEQLQVTEKRALRALRILVKQLKNRSLMLRLSSLVATYQVSHDRMKYLKQSYK